MTASANSGRVSPGRARDVEIPAGERTLRGMLTVPPRAVAVVAFAHGSGRFESQLEDYLPEEQRHQLAEIARRKALFREVRPAVPIAGRTVIVTDDGIATGATMIAALEVVQTLHPREAIVAVPVASPDRLIEIRQLCDDIVCLTAPERFHSVGQFYADFPQIEDAEVVQLLREFSREPPAGRVGDNEPSERVAPPRGTGLSALDP